MINIIRQGNKTKHHPVYLAVCHCCDCEWETDEIKSVNVESYATANVAKCPCCGERTSDIKQIRLD